MRWSALNNNQKPKIGTNKLFSNLHSCGRSWGEVKANSCNNTALIQYAR